MASVLFTTFVLSLLALYIAGGVGLVNLDTLHLPGFLNRIWGLFLEDPGTWSAIASGGFAMFFSRVIVVTVKPLEKDIARMWWIDDRLIPVFRKRNQSQQRLRFMVRVVYAALTLPYGGMILTMISLWGGFWLAGFLLASFYTYTAVDTVKTGVYALLQQPPGAVLYALTRIFMFGVARGKEKEKARATLQEVRAKDPQLFGSFGPKLRLSQEFYLRWVPRILGISLALFAGYGALLFSGFASGTSPQAWQITSVLVCSIVAGILIGWCGCWLSTLVVWVNTFGRPRTKEDWWGVNKAAFAAMCGSTLGPISQGVGFLMAAVLGHGQSQAIHLGLYVFFGHVVGDLLSQIVVLATAKQMSGSPKQGDDTQ
ncbi:hypothetical protein [Ktedonospora formicarum]|nr:hypothetical protein [Ktedonospora formicarum]